MDCQRCRVSTNSTSMDYGGCAAVRFAHASNDANPNRQLFLSPPSFARPAANPLDSTFNNVTASAKCAIYMGYGI